jgi:hypothetical protein
MDPPSPAAADLLDLAEKYGALARLRAQRDGDGAQADRATLRGLAARYPGCLRELDTLGPGEISRRARAAQEAAAGGPREPWMAWVWSYHRLMGAALATKRAIGRGGPRREELPALVARAAEVAGLPLGEAFVLAVATPPQRRLGVAILRLLGELFARPPAEISGALFPARRPSPYTLEET